MELWDSEDYFTLLTEHAIRGLVLLGAPHPQDVLAEDKPKSWLAKLFCCLGGGQEEPVGWQVRYPRPHPHGLNQPESAQPSLDQHARKHWPQRRGRSL